MDDTADRIGHAVGIHGSSILVESVLFALAPATSIKLTLAYTSTLNVLDSSFMQDVGTRIFIAVLSGLFGALIVRWWDRARPFVMLQGFADSIVPGETVNCPDELLQLTRDSWNTDALASTLTTVAVVNKVFIAARDGTADYKAAEEKLPTLLKKLRAAKTDEAVVEGLRDIMSLRGVTHVVSTALKRSELTMPAPVSDQPSRVVIPHGENPANNGCYRFWWKGTTTDFSDNLDTQAPVKPRLQPFIDAVSALNKPALVKVFSDSLPLITNQARIHSRLFEVIRPIQQEHIRWTAKVWVANYGATPMIVWRDCELVVKGRSQFRIKSQLNIESETQPRVREMLGPCVIRVGESVTFWAATTEGTHEIPEAHLLNAHYTEKDAKARLRLQITQRGTLLGRHRKSKYVTFEGSLQLPA